MKRIHTNIVLGLLAVGVLLMAGCKREYGTVTLGANIDNGSDAKVYIDNLTPCWHNNDRVRINSGTYRTSAALGSSAQITNVLQSNGYLAIYPDDIVLGQLVSNRVDVNLPYIQQYEMDSRGDQKVKVPMGANSSNESLTFHNLCSLIKVVISSRMNEDFVLDRIIVTAGSAYLSGRGTATVTGQPSDKVFPLNSLGTRHTVSLEFPSGSRPTIGRGDRDTYVYYIIVPEFTEDNVTITLSSQGRYATFEKRASLQHNKIAQLSLTVRELTPEVPIIDGALPGLFSVSATRQVHFSQGNLQFQASTNTWRFAEHQYDYVGGYFGSVSENGVKSDNTNISSTYSGWIDLFGWGTSGWNSGAVCYQPWSTSTSTSDYYPGGSYSNSLTGAYAEADWAWHNAISNGGNATHQWRTLTCAEWDYLLNIRANASSKRGTGNINGVGGLIILPDNWTLPSGCTFTSGFASNNWSYDDGWSHNSYTYVQWALMEAAGAVFLPAAGYRFITSVDNADSDGGYYWSSTPYNGEYVNTMVFWGPTLGAAISMNRCAGHSVRPVQDIN
jgi:hypothetical protein